MLNKKYYKGIVNKVVYGDKQFIRIFHLEEKSNNQKNELINLRLFEKLRNGDIVPIYEELITDKDLINTLKSTTNNLDIEMNIDEIEEFLNGLISYTEISLDILVDVVSKLNPNSKILIYKEYMGVFYTVILEDGLAKLFEIKLLEKGKISFSHVEDNLIDKILIDDFCKYINDEMELYIKVSDNKFVAITNIENKRCYMDIVVTEPDAETVTFDLNSIRFTGEVSQEEIQNALKVASLKVEQIADLFE